MNLRQLMISRAMKKPQGSEYEYRGNPRNAVFGKFNDAKAGEKPDIKPYPKVTGVYAANESETSW